LQLKINKNKSKKYKNTF